MVMNTHQRNSAMTPMPMGDVGMTCLRLASACAAFALAFFAVGLMVRLSEWLRFQKRRIRRARKAQAQELAHATQSSRTTPSRSRQASGPEGSSAEDDDDVQKDSRKTRQGRDNGARATKKEDKTMSAAPGVRSSRTRQSAEEDAYVQKDALETRGAREKGANSSGRKDRTMFVRVPNVASCWQNEAHVLDDHRMPTKAHTKCGAKASSFHQEDLEKSLPDLYDWLKRFKEINIARRRKKKQCWYLARHAVAFADEHVGPETLVEKKTHQRRLPHNKRAPVSLHTPISERAGGRDIVLRDAVSQGRQRLRGDQHEM